VVVGRHRGNKMRSGRRRKRRRGED